MFLRAEGLKKYGTKGMRTYQVLSGVNLDLNYGEMVCLMGPSGSGQSTLFHILAGLVQSDIGHLTYLRDQVEQSPKEMIFGVVFESDNLFEDFKVKGNFKIQAMMARMSKGRFKERFDLMVKRYGISALLDDYPQHLSEMDRKWISLAKMELLSPDYYFLDEPTVSMSPMFKARYLDTIKGLSRSAGVLVKTDDIVCGSYADRIIYISEGLVKGELKLEPSLLMIEREAQLYGWLKGKGW